MICRVWSHDPSKEEQKWLHYYLTHRLCSINKSSKAEEYHKIQIFSYSKQQRYTFEGGGQELGCKWPLFVKKGSTKCGISPMKILPTPWKKMQDMILWSQGHWCQIAEKVRTIGLHMEHYKPSLALLMLILPDFYFWYFLHLKEQQ